MAGAPTPPVLLAAIASAAADGGSPGNKTNPMPETATGSNAASVEGGFPAITMQNELAGGKPPLGQDVNGLLFLVSSHTLYVECGQTYFFNATLAAKIGGYLAGTILGMADGTGLWLCTTNANSANPDTGGAGWVPIAAYGKTTVTGLTGGTVTLTPAQTKYGVIILQGVLTSNLAIVMPATTQEWLIINATSGAFSTTVRGSSGGVAVPQGGFAAPVGVYSIGDGNIYPTVAPVNLPIDQNPNPLTIVQRTNTGQVLATYFVGNTGLENPTVGAVIVQNSAADGLFRKIGLTNFEAQLLLQGMGGALVNGQVPFSVVAQWASALFSSPAFTGVPTTPTAAAGTSNGQVASTAFASPPITVSGNNVCIPLPNGFKLQMGFASGGQNIAVAFPVAFSSRVWFTASCTSPRNFMGGQGTNFTSAVTLAGMTITVDPNPGSGYWLAIGQ